MDVLVSVHAGHEIEHGGHGERNAYEVWREVDGDLYVKMEVLLKGETLYVRFDHEHLDKVLNEGGTWSVDSNGYARKSHPNMYLHHLLLDFEGTGRGYGEASVDHYNRDKLDNRIEKTTENGTHIKGNLRLVPPEVQHANAVGIIPGTKRSRQSTAIDLPVGIEQKMMPMYVSYRKDFNKEKEPIKEYFIIERHPVWANNITINGHKIRERIKSEEQGLWVDPYVTPRVPFPIIKKLNEIKAKIEKLNEAYNIWINRTDKTDKNVVMDEEDPVIVALTKKKEGGGGRTRTIYKYDKDYNLVEEYDSVKNAAEENGCSDTHLRRFFKSEKMYEGHYYKTQRVEEDDEDE